MFSPHASLITAFEGWATEMQTELSITSIPVYCENWDTATYPSIYLFSLSEGGYDSEDNLNTSMYQIGVLTNGNDSETNRKIRKSLNQKMHMNANYNQAQAWIDLKDYELSESSPPILNKMVLRPLGVEGWTRVDEQDPRVRHWIRTLELKFLELN